MSSAAEERIRIKAEAALRATWPDARIVHELTLRQGGCRIDVAAITPTRIIVAEVKSERDVLDRLERQIAEAEEVADGVFVITAEKHVEAASKLIRRHYKVPCFAEDAIEIPHRFGLFERRIMAATCNAPARLAMLWAAELRTVAGTGSRIAREGSIIKASEELTGGEVRRRVCAALRARHFPRGDDPILSELFPVPTKGAF